MASSAELSQVDGLAAMGIADQVDELLLGTADNTGRLEAFVQRALIKAIRCGHCSLVRHLLRRWSADSNHSYSEMFRITPLGMAARLGNSEIVASLLEAGADPDLPEQRLLGYQPLRYAVKAGHRHVVELLFRAGATPDSRISSGYCALACAVENGDHDIVHILVCNSRINPSFLGGEVLTTALCLAVQESPEIVRLLLACGADPNRCSRGLNKQPKDLNGTPIMVAARSCSLTTIEHLLRAGANPNPDVNSADQQPAIVAARFCAWPIIARLLEAIKDASDDDEKSNSLLLRCSNAAACACNGPVLQELLKFREVREFLSTDPSLRQGLYSLAENIARGNSDNIELFCQILNMRSEEDKQHFFKQAISYSAQEEQQDSAKKLLNLWSPPDVERKQLLGRILSTAVHSGSENTMRMAINFGLRPAVDLSASDCDFLIARALERTDSKALSILLENGLSIAEFIEHKPDRLVRSLDTEAANCSKNIMCFVLGHLTSVQVQAVAHAAITGGFIALSISLVANLEDLSCRSTNTDNWTLLMRAADRGYVEIVQALLAKGVDREETVEGPHGLRSALDIARSAGHQAIVNLLDGSSQLLPSDHTEGTSFCTSSPPFPAVDFRIMLQEIQISECPTEDAAMSQRLHQLLVSAGFTQERAQFQCQMAEFLQKLAGHALRPDRRVMTGSYSDGWGNSLVQVTGKTARDSDIDWTVIQEGETFHIFFGCQCVNVRRLRLEVVEGHAKIEAHAGSQPAVAAPPCGVRPAQDTCYAYMCCSSFHTHRINALISNSVNCEGNVHLVRATRPDKTAELRVSFSFQEKKVLQNLTTEQGQLFILLKFLFKRLIPKIWNTPGLKTYHAKTLLFFMLERNEDPQEWEPRKLVSLFRESLLLMLELTANEAKPEVCMPHFFLEKAPLFFKGAAVGSPVTKLGVFECIRRVLLNLEEFEGYLAGHVKPLDSNASFYFYPFTLLPLAAPAKLTESKLSYFADIYSLVYFRLVDLKDLQPEQSRNFFDNLKCANNLTCMKCARVVLEALAHLKLGDESSATLVLKQLEGHQTKRLWDPTQTLNVSGYYGNFKDYDFEEHEYKVLRENDWAWKFCFVYSPESIKLEFLPKEIVSCCVSHLSHGNASHSYVNFYSLWRCLTMYLSPEHLDKELEKTLWFTDLKEDADYEELFAFSVFCSDGARLRICAERIRAFLGPEISKADDARVGLLEEKAMSMLAESPGSSSKQESMVN